MMNIRYRTSTSAWPGFVDLFSNLVIILIFLLIVFVFLWTTTNVFNNKTTAQSMASLKQTNLAQAEQIEQMAIDEKEAKRLLILARNQLEALEKSNQTLTAEINEMVEKTSEGSLPAFVAAFTKHQKISKEEIDAVQQMIDRYRKGEL